VSANLPLELVQKLLGSDSPLMELRFSPSLNIQEEVLAVYHSLLNLKNIPLLQEAYRYVVSLLVLLEMAKPFSHTQLLLETWVIVYCSSVGSLLLF
jgi:PI-3-kinase-related kinase SMG-1